MDEKEKKDTLEFFDKLLDLKFQSEDLIAVSYTHLTLPTT